MNKLFIKLCFSWLVIFATLSGITQASAPKPTCPSVEKIKVIPFTYAKKIKDKNGYYSVSSTWGLFPKLGTDHHWLISIDSIPADNSVDALVTANAILATLESSPKDLKRPIQFNNPDDDDKPYWMCVYHPEHMEEGASFTTISPVKGKFPRRRPIS